jgi:hypothetical protein
MLVRVDSAKCIRDMEEGENQVLPHVRGEKNRITTVSFMTHGHSGKDTALVSLGSVFEV